MFQLDTADPRRKRMLDGSEADTPDGGEAAQLSPRITATSAGGPTAYVPAPRIGAPSGQPILKAPEPTQPKQTAPAAPQSVAQVAMGTSAPSPTPAPTPTPRIGPPAPINTMSGEWTPPVSAPGSAPLIASAAGGTMTPGGDASNPFKGLETDQGGGFGGYDTAPLANDAAGRTFKQYDQDFVKNANAMKQVPPLSPAEFQAMTAADNGANAVKDKIAKGQPVSDKELAFVRQARGMELQQDTASPTFGTFGTKAGTATAADPELQQRLLASGATAADVGQAGAIAPQVGAPPGVTATPGKVQTTMAGGVGVGPGGGAPAVGGSGTSGTPAFPSTPSPGIGAPVDVTDLDPVQQAMRSETLRRLQNPSPYDDALWQKEVDRAKASSEEQWKGRRDALDADLAARGINWSSVAGDKLSDFNTARGRSWDDVLTGFLSDRAKGIGSARDQAFNAGSTERNYYDKLRQDAIGNQFDVTRLAEALRQGREGTALDWTRLGLGALGQSADNSADIGSGLAQSAAGTNTGDYLAQWIAQFYGKRAPKPAIADPNANMTP